MLLSTFCNPLPALMFKANACPPPAISAFGLTKLREWDIVATRFSHKKTKDRKEKLSTTSFEEAHHAGMSDAKAKGGPNSRYGVVVCLDQRAYSVFPNIGAGVLTLPKISEMNEVAAQQLLFQARSVSLCHRKQG